MCIRDRSGTVTSSGTSSGSSSLNVDFSYGQIFHQSQIADNLDYKEGIIQSFYVNGDTIEFDFIGVKAYPILQPESYTLTWESMI